MSRALRDIGSELASCRPELEKELKRESRSWARKRLIAVHAFVAGKDFWGAAFAAKTTPGSVRSWLRQLESGGLAALLSNKRVAKPYPLHMTAREIATARRSVARLLRTERRAWARTRLAAIAALLSGQSLKAAARSVGVKPESVSWWFRLMHDGGCTGLLSHPPAYEPRCPVVEPHKVASVRQAIDGMLRQQPMPCARSQQRLRALLLALSGDVDQAAKSACVRPATLRRWLSIVHREGPAAILEKRHTGRPLQR